MKKKIALALTILFVFSLVACGGGKDGSKKGEMPFVQMVEPGSPFTVGTFVEECWSNGETEPWLTVSSQNIFLTSSGYDALHTALSSFNDDHVAFAEMWVTDYTENRENKTSLKMVRSIILRWDITMTQRRVRV